MKLSFRGVVYESPFPTLELVEHEFVDKDHEIAWRFQHLRAIRSQRYPDEASVEKITEKVAAALAKDAILVAVWEPAPVTETRTRPFLFVAKHLLESEEEAQEVLNQYLRSYAARPVNPPARVFVGTKESASNESASPML